MRLGRRLRSEAARLAALARRLAGLLTDGEIATRAEVAERLAELAEARRDAAAWRERAVLCEARIGELESEIAISNMVAMDLRARLVCLHGKLATTAATARYQSSTTALAARAQRA